MNVRPRLRATNLLTTHLAPIAAAISVFWFVCCHRVFHEFYVFLSLLIIFTS